MTNALEKRNEPALTELLSDPIMLAVLKRDGLTVEDVKKVVNSYQMSARVKPS